jgi:hypothetical protein
MGRLRRLLAGRPMLLLGLLDLHNSFFDAIDP